MGENKSNSAIDWALLVPENDWDQYVPLLDDAKTAGIKLAIGGGLAFSEYSCRMRNTKDVDLFVMPEQHEQMVQILHENGWEDYYQQQRYDRSWIYRACKGELICDIIWTLPNHRYVVEPDWISRGRRVEIHGRWISLVSIEHLILAKLYVFQCDRCDWHDIFNVLNCSGRQIDWTYLLKLLGRDVGLLGALLAAFRWLAPNRAAQIPQFVMQRAGLLDIHFDGPIQGESRAYLLDTRDWFGINVEA